MNKKKNIKKKDSIKTIILVLILIVIILLVSVYLTKLNSEDIVNNEFYQYFGGRKFEYTGAIKITKKGEITEISTNDVNIVLDSSPIYYKNEKRKVLFPETMLSISPDDNGKTSKIVRFSNLYENDNGIYLESQKKQNKINNSFIYDGNDLYFFIEETTIIANEKEYQISPFSYIISSYMNGVEIYDYEKDTYEVIETEDYVIAKTDSYTINTSIDTLKYGEKEQLLLKNINVL